MMTPMTLILVLAAGLGLILGVSLIFKGRDRSPMTEQANRCRQCRHLNTLAARFCSQCGHQL